MSNPLMQYKQQSINTMSSAELILTLYDEALKNLRIAVMKFDSEEVEIATTCTNKAKEIFKYLMESLDFNYDISNNLFKLYLFFNQEIISSEITLKSKPITELLPLIEDLKSTWTQANRSLHTQNASSISQPRQLL
ncbi:MAG: flagellar export chaperone FliS [Oscillospiraceae bacterium]